MHQIITTTINNIKCANRQRKGKFFALYAMKAKRGKAGLAPFIPNLGT